MFKQSSAAVHAGKKGALPAAQLLLHALKTASVDMPVQSAWPLLMMQLIAAAVSWRTS